METIVVVVHVIAAISIVALVLLQQGKGADAGAAFGSGSSQTVFGAGGTGNFLTRSTSIAATVFFVTSLTLAIYAKQNTSGLGLDASIVDPSLLSEMAVPATDVPQLQDEAPSVDASDLPVVSGQ